MRMYRIIFRSAARYGRKKEWAYKFQIPVAKSQTNPKRQFQMTETNNYVFGFGSLVTYLGFGAWNLVLTFFHWIGNLIVNVAPWPGLFSA